MRPDRGLTLVLGVACLCVASLRRSDAQGPGTLPPDDPTVVAGRTSQVVLAPTTRLPYPMDSELLVDRQPAMMPSIPGLPANAVRKCLIAAFRPRQPISLDELARAYVAAQYLPNQPGVALEVSETAPANATTVRQARVYRSVLPDEYVILGSIRETRSQAQILYGVVISGNIGRAEALVRAEPVVSGLISSYVLEERTRRLQIPIPGGSQPSSPMIRIEGLGLVQLAASIEQSTVVSPRVKEIARIVLPQASGVTHMAWQTPNRISDKGFFTFYLQQAEKLGWGQPVSQDQTRVGHPTLLFQRPANQGVVLVRAQPTPLVTGKLNKPSTTLYILVIEGRIDVTTLRSR